MPIQMIDDDKWMVQVQRGGMRKTRRGTGGREAALTAERELIEMMRRKREATVGFEGRAIFSDEDEASLFGCPTLAEYYKTRWREHAKVIQRGSTRDGDYSKWNYLLHYMGDKTLEECAGMASINRFTELMVENGALSFARKRNGKPRKTRVKSLSNSTINKCLTILRSVLRLAWSEGTISTQPKIQLLPQNDSAPVLAPSDEELKKLLAACERLRPWAPLLPEVVELACHTGLRRTELFTLTWNCVEMDRKALRVERKQIARKVNGQVWTPKGGKFREIPLSDTAFAILSRLRENHPHDEDDLVIPSTGGSPYYPIYRDDVPQRGSGKGYFYDAVADAGLKGKVTFHGLRHYFAVTLLSKGAPLAVVSELMGHTSIQLTVKRYGRFSTDAQIKFDTVRLLDD